MLADSQNHTLNMLRDGVCLNHLPIVLGRSSDADVRLDDRWASRRNTEIVDIDGTLIVRDLGSANGTLLNGEHITESPLFPGDKLTVGMTTFELTSDGRMLEPTTPSQFDPHPQ